MEIFDELIRTTVKPDGEVETKRYISNDETLRQMEFQEACEEFVAAEKAWKKLDASVRLDKAADVCAWWDALEARYQTEKRVWELFTGGDRSPRSGRMYLQFRETLLSGRSTRADA